MKIKIAFTENERKLAEHVADWVKFYCVHLARSGQKKA